jgi:hypothetical protein
MEDIIQGATDIDKPAHVVIEEAKPRIGREAENVFLRPGGIIVHADNFMPLLEKTFAEMRPDKPGASSDQVPSHHFFL